MSGPEAAPEEEEVKKPESTPDAEAESDDGSGSEETSDDEPVEQLYAGRQRRKNQGNRYAALLGQEQEVEEDEQMAEIFEEIEGDDESFAGSEAEEGEADADAAAEEDDSDTDNEDQGPAATGNDLEGEKELRKQERAVHRTQKRKAIDITKKAPAPRKRVKIDDLPSTAAAPSKKRKKSERVSWLQTDAPVRTSSRALAVENKAKIEAKMKADEARQEKTNAKIQEAQKKREAAKVKPKTQAERLAEAAKVEEINSKSLNRWEEMERDRKQRQKARLDALQNRQIEGPVIRWRSSKAEWADDKLSKVGKIDIQIVEEPIPKQIKPAPTALAALPAHPQGEQISTFATMTPTVTSAPDSGTKISSADSSTIVLAPPDVTSNPPNPPNPPSKQDEQAPPPADPPKDGFTTLMADVQQYASNDKQAEGQTTQQPALQKPANAQGHSDNYNAQAFFHQNEATAPIPTDPATPNPTPTTDPTSAATLLAQFQQTTPIPPAPPPPPKTITHSTHNTITLLNFSPHLITHPQIQRHILLSTPLPPTIAHSTLSTRARGGRKPLDPSGRSKAAIKSQVELQAPPKPDRPLCAVTGQVARYRDPMTGLPYAGREAFRTVRRLVRGGAQWSQLLGAWVGTRGDAARAVPVGFKGRVEGMEREKGKEKENGGVEGVKVEVEVEGAA